MSYKEAFDMICRTCQQVFAGSWYLPFIICAVIVLLIGKKRTEAGVFLSVFSAAVIVLFSFPPFAAAASRFLREGVVYWRMLWLLPVSVLIAYAVIWLAGHFQGIKVKAVFILAAGILLVIGGKNLYAEGPFVKAVNREKIPLRTMMVAQVIEENARTTGNPYKRLAGPPDITCQIRQVDPSIRQSYARVFHTEELEPKDGWNYYLRVMYDNLEDEKGKIAAYLNYQEVNYAVFRSGRGMDETMEKGGFARIWQENDLEIWYNPNTVETRTKDQGYGPA